ncbi:MAG: hypothetical protein M1817_003029 [Caeruleum heppii]|nr:MAG: hypothetical protein M1817_003029 [Caeruleum heppii]
MVTARTSDHEDPPVPSYEEAIFAQPSSTSSHLNGAERSHELERQGLLGQSGATSASPCPPSSHSARLFATESRGRGRETYTSLRRSDESDRSSLEQLHQEMGQMEMLDPLTDILSERQSRIRDQLSKRITTLTNSLSSLQLPFEVRLPSFPSIRFHVPEASYPGLIVCGRLFALALIFFVVYFFISEITPKSVTGGYDPDVIRAYVQGNVDRLRIREYLEKLTRFDHIAGTRGDLALAEYVEGVFAAAKLERVQMNEYEVYLNYPRPSGRRIAIVSPPELVWEAQLEEDVAITGSGDSQQQTLVFHGHSRAGNITGPLIYANYGSRADFARLQELGIDVSGAIVLVRYYGSQGDRALKVKAAELAGAAGCIIYSDPAEDGFRRGEVWPSGRWQPEDGVQRGAVSLMSWVVGDVLTPGWASTPGAHRLSKDDNPGLVNIPSLPLSWRDAQSLLSALRNHGEKVSADWIGGVPNIEEWWTGDETSPIVHLQNEQDEQEKQPIWNVLGSITGIEQSEKTIIVGNHRDAWCAGGADPGSGTAVMLEVATLFGELVQRGWQPRRTIQFASWDGEEYNLIGSTEWVEDNIEGLRLNGVAYLNVDTAVSGSDFRAASSPLFQKALMRVLERVAHPLSNKTLRTVWDETNSKLGGLGAGSDYVAFQDLAGTSSIDMGFDGPGFPYHSCYDNFEWMSKFGDPTWESHAAMAQVWALLILEIADSPVLPYDFIAYASAVDGYVKDLEAYANGQRQGGSTDGDGLDFTKLRDASKAFTDNAGLFQRWEQDWLELVNDGRRPETNVVAIHRMGHNNRMSNFETHLLDLEEGGGLPGREQFKHVIFAPQAWSGYDEAYFPGVRDALDEGNRTLAQQQLDKAAAILEKASLKLLN